MEGGRNFRLNPEHVFSRKGTTPMSITRTSFATRTRTWLLIAGLSALLVGIGALIGILVSQRLSSR